MKPLLNADKITYYLEDVIKIFDLDTGVKTIGDFVSKVELLAEAYRDEKDPTNQKYNNFKGDMFELLGEIFFNAFANSPKVGLRDFAPVSLAEDFGVDGIGVNANNDRVAVQFKYRSNPLEAIDYPSLAKTYTSGRKRFKLSLDEDDTIWLFTTGGGVSASCSELGSSLRVIHRDVIAGSIDNNHSFWIEAQERIGITLDAALNK